MSFEDNKKSNKTIKFLHTFWTLDVRDDSEEKLVTKYLRQLQWITDWTLHHPLVIQQAETDTQE